MQERKKQTRTVQEEMIREQKFWKQNQLWALLLLAAVILFNLLGSPGHSVVPGPEELVLTMHDGKTATVTYGQITSVQLLEQPDYGKTVDGTEEKSGKSGSWENSLWGNYTLCVYASCDWAVRILAEETCYVVNLASEAETRQLYQLLLDRNSASR